MKKTLLFSLLAVAFAAQAQQFEHFTPKYNPLCTHERIRIKDLEWKNPRTVMFEVCPDWEGLEDKMACIDVDDNPDYIRCYHSEYIKSESIHGKTARVCHFIVTRGDVDVLCSESTRFRSAAVRYRGVTSFSEAAGR